MAYRHPPDRIYEKVCYLPMSEKISRMYTFITEQRGDNIHSTSLMPRLLPHIEDWCVAQIKTKHGICHIPKRLRPDPQYDWALWFENTRDAILFKMKWL